jgi:hypothetical protein
VLVAQVQQVLLAETMERMDLLLFSQLLHLLVVAVAVAH